MYAMASMYFQDHCRCSAVRSAVVLSLWSSFVSPATITTFAVILALKLIIIIMIINGKCETGF